MKRYFDILIIAPLEEEFDAATSLLGFIEDFSTDKEIRFSVGKSVGNISILLVKQNVMGKTAAQIATISACKEFDIGLVACLGIAGGLSADINIGDVCYSGDIVDVLDNAKVSGAEPVDDVAFSPTHYDSPSELTVAFNITRVHPESKSLYCNWQEVQFTASKAKVPGEFLGKNGRLESIQKPKAKDGLIACGSVSGSKKYNKKLQSLDRKVLAIETEAGGVFSAAKQLNVPAIAIRGISDYAGADKNKFEEETKGKAREIAVENAVTYLTSHIATPRIQGWLSRRRAQVEGGLPQLPQLIPENDDTLQQVLLEISSQIEEKLKELAPSYALLNKGYKLPVPRIRVKEAMASGAEGSWGDPQEIRDVLKTERVFVLSVPKEYPDRSLSWIIARDMLSVQLQEKQIAPIVLDAKQIRQPNSGLKELTDARIKAMSAAGYCRPAFIVDDFDFDSKTRSNFLAKCISEYEDAILIVASRNGTNIISESEFVDETSASLCVICDVSFVEIAFFLQKNFEISGPASEVVATKLRKTFHNYDLPAHPTYFAGISKDVLSALLQANRRAELIELAVAGYLSFVVADDPQTVALSRKTRELFLTELAFAVHVDKRTFDEAQLVMFVDEFKKKYDFGITSIQFIESFIEKGILHFEDKQVSFTLPFIESFVLANRLKADPKSAKKYFEFATGEFDIPTFSLYAELGPSDQFISDLEVRLGEGISHLTDENNAGPIIVGEELNLAMLSRGDRMNGLRERLQRATADVQQDKDDTQEKQRLLDAADKVREKTAKHAKQNRDEADEAGAAEIDADNAAIEAWYVATILLGAGAERLEAQCKRKLIDKVVRLTSLIIDKWTRRVHAIDFKSLKEKLTEDPEILRLSSGGGEDFDDAKKLVVGLVDMMEYVFIAEPFRRTVGALCEEAGDVVLAESLSNVTFSTEPERLIHGMWMADVDVPKGKDILIASIKNLPKALFLRVSLTTHLMRRVFWQHWKKENRLILLDVAEESLKISGQIPEKAKYQRLIRSGETDDEE